VAAIVSMYDPQVIVLGGGLSLQKSYYEQSTQIAKVVFGSHMAPRIVPALMGDASGKIGAASLFFG
jgi:predicted NBD/HSP70 family sugar kinase